MDQRKRHLDVLAVPLKLLSTGGKGAEVQRTSSKAILAAVLPLVKNPH